MLGFPVPSKPRPDARQEEDLCCGIQELIAKAVDGRLTSNVIDLFIQVYYVAQEPTEDQAQKLKACRAGEMNVNAYMMSTAILDGILKALRGERGG